MKEYICNICNKEFKQKCHLNKHLYKKIRPCKSENIVVIPKYIESIPKHTESISKYTENNKKFNNEDIKDIHDILNNNINTLLNIDPLKVTDSKMCIYCNKTFIQKVSLNRHLKDRCKFKKNFDELEKLKDKLISITTNYQNLEKEHENLEKEYTELKKEIVELKHVSSSNTNVINNTCNNKIKNQINNGVINNNLNVQLVQFGCENIDDIDSKEALNIYYKSTGGNILSNILKLVNLNEKYPQNHNICMSDLSRELVKIFDGKKFVVKKFKNIEGEIMYKVIRNTHKLVDKIENDDSIILTESILSKLKINNISIKLINGVLPEDIVRDEMRVKEKLLKDNNLDYESENEEINDEKQREFNLEERLRITHLQNKQQGLINISLDRLKDELYNGKNLVENSELFVKTDKKKYQSNK